LCRHFGIPYRSAHRALNDAEATAALLQRLIAAHGTELVMQGVVHPARAQRA
jgi:DNA polymerase III epsilon subunit-like protein